MIGQANVPAEPEPGEPNRDLPPKIVAELCAHPNRLTSVERRTAVELAIDTGRRPEEICELDFDCLTRDEDMSVCPPRTRYMRKLLCVIRFGLILADRPGAQDFYQCRRV